MSSDNQVALARIQRGTAANLSRATRQAVPPFLQKLYELVSDSATDDLIRWSETGDSFFVLDKERMAHDVLPRWFKHNNFASLVRQLNNYGFHKIPHLQQGVLRSDTETELWNFEHPNFHRGQPDLLCLISRKKQVAERGAEDSQLDDGEGPNPTASTGGSVLDINSIINGISAIKRHQTTISADLSDLKSSNQHLWQEAIAARERHKKHQDTINRILKFLAGVFGNTASPHKGPTSDGPPHAVVPRKRQRLMIEQGKEADVSGFVDHTSKPMTVNFEQLEDDVNIPSRFSAVETPSAITSSPSPPSISTSVQGEEMGAPQLDHTATSSVTPADILANASPNLPSSSTTLPSTPAPISHYTNQTSEPIDHPYNSSSMNQLTSSSQNANQDAVLQAILNSPVQLQRLLNALTAQSNYPLQPLTDPPPDLEDPSIVHREPYLPQYDYNPDDPSFAPASVFPPPSHPNDGSRALLPQGNDDTANLGTFIDNTQQQLLKTQIDTEHISESAQNVQADINSLIEKLGLDADTALSLQGQDEPVNKEPSFPRPSPGLSDPHMFNGIQTESAPDFDFDAFLNQLSDHEGVPEGGFDITEHLNPNAFTDGSSINPSTEQMSAFLDEVNSQSDASSPTATRASSLEETTFTDSPTRKKGRKRKSDIIDAPDDMHVKGKAYNGPKAKRKR